MPEPPAVRYVRAAAGPDPGGPADAELLRRFADTRDQAAFELLVWRHAGMVQAAARAVVRDRHLAEDAAQAAFLALARHAGRVRANPSGWLYRTARRAALRLRRAGGVSPPFQSPARTPHRGEAGTGGLHPPLASDEVAVLHDELARLPDRYRLPVLLCLAEGLTHPQAAARLGWPVGTVAGRLSRAKALLRDRLARRGVTAGLGLLVAETAGGGWVLATASAAAAFAAGGVAGVSPSVILLAKGLVPTMTVTKWATATGLLAVAAVTGSGVWATARPDSDPPAESPQPAARPEPPNPDQAPDRGRRQQSLAALRQIAQAMLDYESIAGRLPADIRGPAPNADAAPAGSGVFSGGPPGAGAPGMMGGSPRPLGPPLLSWRVAVLPFLGHQALYRKFRQQEPWDSPHNKALLAEMPDVYRLWTQPKGATDTYYQGFAGPGTVFDPAKPVRITDVTDGTALTIGVAEVGPPVPWTKPADLSFDPDLTKPVAGVWPFRTVHNVAAVSGDAYPISPTVDHRVLKQLILVADGSRSPVGDWPWPALRPRLPAETPAEKAELARVQAETPKLLAELAELMQRVRCVEDAQEWNDNLRVSIKELKGLTAPPAK